MHLPFGAIVNVVLALTQPRRREPRNGGIHLAVRPRCGSLDGDYADVNAGIWPERIKTVVSFGDSYTDGGHDDGGPLDPPVLYPPNSLAGGRSTNGYTWVEYVAQDLGAEIKDYAQSGACIDLSLWPSNPKKVDFLGQMKTFLGQNNTLDPESTLYSIFFGINDYLASLNDGDHMEEAAQTLLRQIEILSSPPTNARYFVVLDDYGRGYTAPQGEAYKQTVYNGLHDFHTRTSGPRLAVSYVDFYSIWNGVLGSDPGYKAFGYNSTDACAASYPWCDDPNGYFYWISGHPSNTTNRIMADFVDRVWRECRIWGLPFTVQP